MPTSGPLPRPSAGRSHRTRWGSPPSCSRASRSATATGDGWCSSLGWHCSLGSAGCALSPNAGLLIATRAVHGVGGGLAVPLSLVLISEAFPPEQRARAIGIWGAITGMAVAVAPLVGGAIVSGLAWRWIFWVNVPIGVAVLAAGLTRLARSPRVSARIDLAGMLLGASAVGGVAYAVQEGPAVGWTSAQVLTAGIGGLVVAGVTMAWERRCAYPYGAGFLLPQFLQFEHHYSPIGVGIAFLAWTGVIPFVAPVAGQIAQRRGERIIMVAGIGTSLAFPATASATMQSVTPDLMGPAGGVGTVAFQLGAAFGVSLVSAVFSSAGGYASAATFVDGLRPALLAVAVVTAIGVAAGNRFHGTMAGRRQAAGTEARVS